MTIHSIREVTIEEKCGRKRNGSKVIAEVFK